jgi:hypothetical protein
VSTKNSKAAVILDRCAILGPATAVFRVTLGINQAYLPTSQVTIFVDGKRCTQEMLEALCAQLNQPMMPEEMLQATAA